MWKWNEPFTKQQNGQKRPIKGRTPDHSVWPCLETVVKNEWFERQYKMKRCSSKQHPFHLMSSINTTIPTFAWTSLALDPESAGLVKISRHWYMLHPNQKVSSPERKVAAAAARLQGCKASADILYYQLKRKKKKKKKKKKQSRPFSWRHWDALQWMRGQDVWRKFPIKIDLSESQWRHSSLLKDAKQRKSQKRMEKSSLGSRLFSVWK